VLVCPVLRGVVARLLSEQQMIARIGVCGHQLGARASLCGTAAAADDLEAVRAALRLQRLDLWGASYGTYLMTVYAARHPAHVQSLVLHGAYPIDFDPWALDRLAAARRSIHLVCARTGGRPAVPRVPARLRLRSLTGGPTRHLPRRAGRTQLARARTLLRRGVDGYTVGGSRHLPAMAERSHRGPPVPRRQVVVGRTR